MRLHAAANRFNSTQASDAYNPSIKFMCQFEAMNFSKIDGVAVRKRQISVAPDVVVPARGAIAIDGEVYLAGHAAPDYWDNTVIRQTLILQGADGVSAILTMAEALGNLPGVSAYAATVFMKYGTDERTSSEFFPQYQVFLGGAEMIAAGYLVHLDDRWFHIKEAYQSASGLIIALGNKFDSSIFEVATIATKTYAPVTDTYTSVTTTAKILRFRRAESFDRVTTAQENNEQGDETIHVLKSAWPLFKQSDTLVLSDGPWRVLAVEDKGLTMSLHTRRD